MSAVTQSSILPVAAKKEGWVRLCEKRERVVFAASSARLPRITSGDFAPKPKGLEDSSKSVP